MGFPEEKKKLLKIVEEADEEFTGKLIEFAKKLKDTRGKFSPEELEKFHSSRKEYLENQENSFSLEDAHEYVRSLKKK